MTTLQRDANRLLGYTAQQTLDYVQSLYEKKFCTYPRTDSRYLTDDMVEGGKRCCILFGGYLRKRMFRLRFAQNRCATAKRYPTTTLSFPPSLPVKQTSVLCLPASVKILMMIARQVLRSVSESYRYRETVAVLTCDGNRYTAKGKTVLNMGWKAYNEKEPADKILPELSDGDELQVADSKIKEGMTKPPARFTEDSLLSAMEVAGAKDMPRTPSEKVWEHLRLVQA